MKSALLEDPKSKSESVSDIWKIGVKFANIFKSFVWESLLKSEKQCWQMFCLRPTSLLL